MNYDEIKRRLRQAYRLVEDDKVAEADELIRSMVGHGLTGNDLRANLPRETLRKLRAYEKSQGK